MNGRWSNLKNLNLWKFDANYDIRIGKNACKYLTKAKIPMLVDLSLSKNILMKVIITLMLMGFIICPKQHGLN
jgi:hypothetical protein